VHLETGKHVRFDIGPCKHACNSIFAHGTAVDELALLTLQESYSLPVLMYVSHALSRPHNLANCIIFYIYIRYWMT